MSLLLFSSLPLLVSAPYAQALRESLAESEAQHAKGPSRAGTRRRAVGGQKRPQTVESDEDVICVGDEQRLLKNSSGGHDTILVESEGEGESSPARERRCQAKAREDDGAKAAGRCGRGPSHFRERLAQTEGNWEWLGWGGADGAGRGWDGLGRGRGKRNVDTVDFGQWDEDVQSQGAAVKVIYLFC